MPHLDFTTMIHPDGRLEWKLFDKVWAIPELCRIRKFPHSPYFNFNPKVRAALRKASSITTCGTWIIISIGNEGYIFEISAEIILHSFKVAGFSIPSRHEGFSHSSMGSRKEKLKELYPLTW